MGHVDKFGAKWSDGNSLKMLSRLQKWYEDSKGLEIVRYYFVESASRKKIWLSSEDYRQCTICGDDLFFLQDKVVEEDSDEGAKDLLVSQKRQIVSLDSSGVEHHSCYRLKSCLRKTGCKESAKPAKRVVPTLKDLLSLSDEDEIDEVFWQSISRDYELKVKPFIFKWLNREINKSNVSDFVKDLAKAEEHTIFYDGRGGEVLMSKVLNIIGVS